MTQPQAPSDSNPRKKRTMITYVKYVAGLLLLLVLGLAMIIVVRFRHDAEIPYTVSTAGITIPTYDEIEIDFTHNYIEATSIPTTCGAAIDLDGTPAMYFEPIRSYFMLFCRPTRSNLCIFPARAKTG